MPRFAPVTIHTDDPQADWDALYELVAARAEEIANAPPEPDPPPTGTMIPGGYVWAHMMGHTQAGGD